MKSNCNGIRYNSCQNTCQEYGLSSNVGSSYQCTAPTEERVTSSSSSGSSETSVTSESLANESVDAADQENSGASGSVTNIVPYIFARTFRDIFFEIDNRIRALC